MTTTITSIRRLILQIKTRLIRQRIRRLRLPCSLARVLPTGPPTETEAETATAASKAMAAVEATAASKAMADKAATEVTDVIEVTGATGATAPQEVSVTAVRGPSCPCGSDGVKPAIRVNL